jgi:hypothetical protein
LTYGFCNIDFRIVDSRPDDIHWPFLRRIAPHPVYFLGTSRPFGSMDKAESLPLPIFVPANARRMQWADRCHKDALNIWDSIFLAL